MNGSRLIFEKPKIEFKSSSRRPIDQIGPLRHPEFQDSDLVYLWRFANSRGSTFRQRSTGMPQSPIAKTHLRSRW